jgi:hypothetical protein
MLENNMDLTVFRTLTPMIIADWIGIGTLPIANAVQSQWLFFPPLFEGPNSYLREIGTGHFCKVFCIRKVCLVG